MNRVFSHRIKPKFDALLVFFLACCLMTAVPAWGEQSPNGEDRAFAAHIRNLAAIGDRSTGTPGRKKAAEYIRKQLRKIGFRKTTVHPFSVPVVRYGESFLTLDNRDRKIALHPIMGNAVSPPAVAPEGISGPLVYAGKGDLASFNGLELKGAVVLMEMDSGRNWIHAANLGAAALIYLGGETPDTGYVYKDKFELTPARFPRFWTPRNQLTDILEKLRNLPGKSPDAVQARLVSEARWERATGENIGCLIPGTHKKRSEELIIVEAFYDSTPLVAGRSPGADEACGAATLLSLAEWLKDHPPDRSVLLLATDGHSLSQAGMREFIWTIRSRSRELKKLQSSLEDRVETEKKILELLGGFNPKEADGIAGLNPADFSLLKSALDDSLKTETDRIARQLILLRMNRKTAQDEKAISALSGKRLVMQRLVWRADYKGLTDKEKSTLATLLPIAKARHRHILEDVGYREKLIKSTRKLRRLVRKHDITQVISLHLSSHGNGVGAFNNGWLYTLKQEVNRVGAYAAVDDALHEAAKRAAESGGAPSILKDTLRPSRLRSWQSWLPDRPAMGGEVSALAGYHGLTLATVNDARPMWGTPDDLPDHMDMAAASAQSRFVARMVAHLAALEKVIGKKAPRNGFSTVSGRVNFLRHGELFPDQPAPGCVVLGFQANTRFYENTDATGAFLLKGVADKKHSLHKVILETYKFDDKTGEMIWAVDKNFTGKDAYRVKMQRRDMETDLVMFTCRQTTLFNLLEPRTLNYMTKINLIDARREADPVRYWWSRIDTRDSTLLSLFLEPGTRFKLTLSDSILNKKLVLTHATDDNPKGAGYLVDDWPALTQTEYRVAKDMWTLLNPRVANLEKHGIYNEQINQLQTRGLKALSRSETALKNKRYDEHIESAKSAWALASRVYNHVEQTQKDVLFGVLFYIALFVPFAFCLERFLFGCVNIYRRIVAFSFILLAVIAIIYQVHPAFELAYSPTVVILAFFIMGLSLVVTLIIFLRFEDEMVLLQNRAQRSLAGEVSRWKAFWASFMIGVSNLRRRRLRTALTCVTLIILTFTIMSFTSVKSLQRHTRLLLQERSPYRGFLVKTVNWESLPPATGGIVEGAFAGEAVVAPRLWLENEDRRQTAVVSVRKEDRSFDAAGMVGMSVNEDRVSGIRKILIGGRWLREEDRHAVVIPDRMAETLGIDSEHPEGAAVEIWGMRFAVVGVFSAKRFFELTDLDGEPMTPVTFPNEAVQTITEVEIDAMESGDDVQEFQSRYQHVSPDLTIIVPWRFLASAGGHFKSVAAIQTDQEKSPQEIAKYMVQRFGLTLFSGEENGVYLYHAGDTMQYSGVPNVIIPMLISVFIVLNTMIGSVVERKREISIYTSVGLAPSHVSFLFIAEAMAFSVLSVVGGYLVAQVSARIFSGTALWTGITVNYSSLSGVGAMALVMAVVLISVIYPSKVAAAIAIPDVNRSWRMPEARENRLEIMLPFLMKTGEHVSAAGFLLAYLQNHQDVSHGLFSTGEISVAGTTTGHEEEEKTPAEKLRIQVRAWLAPFDFGITQTVDIQFVPSDEEGYLAVSIQLKRIAGEANAWGRGNKAFVHELRKQLLVWRSLDQDERSLYQELIEKKTS